MARDDEAIVGMYGAYFRAFQTLDPEAVIPYYHVPCMLLAPQGVLVVATAAEARTLFAGMMKGLEARGYAKSESAGLRVTRLSDDTAVLSTRVVRLKADGDELERFGATYSLRRTDAGWKIVVLTVHDADAVGDTA